METISKRTRLFTLMAMYIGIVGAIFVSSTTSTMLPLAAQEIGGEKIYSLVNNLSGALSVAIMPLYGYIAAKKPSIKPKLFGVSMIIGAVVMLSRVFVTNMWQMIIPGVLYALPSAAIYVLGYAMIRESFDAQKAGVYLGFVATCQSIGMLIGPTIAGVLMDISSWRAVNHIIWPCMLLSGILAFLASGKKAEESAAGSGAKFDAVGAVLLVCFSGGLILALSLGSNLAPFGGMLNNILIVITVVSLVGLVFSIKKKGKDSVLPVGVLKDRNTLCLSLSCLTGMFCNMAVFFFIPTYAIYVLGASATQAALCTTLFSVAGLFMGPIYGRIIGKSGNARGVYASISVLRIIITAVFIFVLKPTSSIWLLWICMLIGSFYNSGSGVTFSVAPQLQIPESYRVQGASVVSVSQNLGGAIGTAVYTLILGTLGFADGMHVSFIVSICGAIASLLFILPLKKKEEA